MSRLAPLLALFVVLLLSSAAGVLSQQFNPAATACPITDFTKVDWSSATEACANPDNNPDFCNSCICGVGIALVLGLDAAGVQVNGQPITALAAGASGDSSAAVNSLLGSCQATLGLQLLQSGALTAPAVSQLAKCDVQAASSTCLEQVQTGQQPAPATSSEEAGEGGRALVPVDSNVYQQIAAASAAPASAPAPAPARSAGSRVTVSMLLSVFAAAVGVDVLLM